MPASSKQLHNAFIALPPQIKEWLASDQITFLIREITDRLGLREAKVAAISRLILRLATQDLEPTDFINELSHELEISFPTAKSIAEDIEHKVLKPIESNLRRDAGVDIKLIYFGKPSAQRAEPKLATGAPLSGAEPPPVAFTGAPTQAKIEMEKPAPPLPSDLSAKALASAEALRERGTPQSTVAPPTTTPAPTPLTQPTEWEKYATPFMLHQEGTIYPTDHKTAKAGPMLNIKVQNYSAEPQKKSPPKPVAVRLEYAPNQQPTTDGRQTINDKQTTDGQQADNKQPATAINGEKARVVNYNEMRTPINNLGMPKASPPENRVDLRKFAKPDSNAVDLRK